MSFSTPVTKMAAYGAAGGGWRKMAGKFLPRVQIVAARRMLVSFNNKATNYVKHFICKDLQAVKGAETNALLTYQRYDVILRGMSSLDWLRMPW
ncbi:unnamed protein product [Porites lobata]|uniref:Uncharacterized protein n=1 Tax=Porites lobata TaxID=104759 RepID=A0ABN8R4S4_9CNID|nr:unnamed protein product [Porites lobata]